MSTQNSYTIRLTKNAFDCISLNLNLINNISTILNCDEQITDWNFSVGCPIKYYPSLSNTTKLMISTNNLLNKLAARSVATFTPDQSYSLYLYYCSGNCTTNKINFYDINFYNFSIFTFNYCTDFYTDCDGKVITEASDPSKVTTAKPWIGAYCVVNLYLFFSTAEVSYYTLASDYDISVSISSCPAPTTLIPIMKKDGNPLVEIHDLEKFIKDATNLAAAHSETVPSFFNIIKDNGYGLIDDNSRIAYITSLQQQSNELMNVVTNFTN